MIKIEDKTMEETMKYISFKVFCSNATYIKEYFYKLSKEEKSQFRKWVYGNTVLREYLKDLIWQYIIGDINRTQLNRGR